MFVPYIPLPPPPPTPPPPPLPPSQCHPTCRDFTWNVENGKLSKYVNVSWDLAVPDLRWKQAYSSPILASLRIHTPPFFTVTGRYHARSNVLDLPFFLDMFIKQMAHLSSSIHKLSYYKFWLLMYGYGKYTIIIIIIIINVIGL